MNKQPFYHRAVVLFTATRDIPREELERILKHLVVGDDIVAGTLEVDEVDSEPGDPADLM